MLSNEVKLKIIMIGPCSSGKTYLANFISDRDTEATSAPRPTKGVRILVFEISNILIGGINYKAEVDLWDCSGDHRFELCWPAIRDGVHGVILVCSPDNVASASREFELLYNYFVSQHKLSAKQCVIFYNTSDEQSDIQSLKLSPTFAKVSQVAVNISSASNRPKIDFSNFISSVISEVKSDKNQIKKDSF